MSYEIILVQPHLAAFFHDSCWVLAERGDT